MVAGQCEQCGLVQITKPVPADELRPKYDWFTYNEPEGHLDQLVEMVTNVPRLRKDSTICGVSFKDDSTLQRMQAQGFKQTWRIDPQSDLGIVEKAAAVESIQARIIPSVAKAIAGKHGPADVVFARHILEHAHDTRNFMKALHYLVKPQGYIVFEVPDCTQALNLCDYSTIWEEHILYFTPTTFRLCFAFGEFSEVHYECFPNSFENSLVSITQIGQSTTDLFPDADSLASERMRAETYFGEMPRHRQRYHDFFSQYQQNTGKIALFGAGHLACSFINLLGVKDYIEFVVDDNPNKMGKYMPGSQLPILGSVALKIHDIKLCLLSLSPDNENQVINNNQAFVQNGGTFSSIFPSSGRALRF